MNLDVSRSFPAEAGHGICASCGGELPEGRLASRCPQCLLALALDPDGAPCAGAAPHLPHPNASAAGNGAPSLGEVGDYDLVEEIAHGGMGTVYKARHRTLRRWVALKHIRLERWNHPESVLRFQLETEAVARLDHPNIVPLHEAGEWEGMHYFTMKLVTGGSLATMLSSGSGEMDAGAAHAPANPATRASKEQLRRWVECLVKVARAVHFAHQHGIIHRDLKPANILLDERGEPMITDFGLAKILESNAAITQTHTVLGSPNYMAPEQAAGRASAISTGVDVYSLGGILYEMLTGEPPFRAATVLETMRKVMGEPLRRPRSLNVRADRDLETICLKCMEKEPERRYPSASEVADDLQRWLDGLPLKTRSASQAELLWRWCKRNPALAGAFSAVAALLVIVAAGSLFAAVHIRSLHRETERVLLRMQLEKADELLQLGDSSRGLALLANVVRRHPTKLDAASRLAFELSFRNYATPAFDPLPHESRLAALTSTREGRALITVTENGEIRHWETGSGRLQWQTNTSPVFSASFNAAAGRLVAATKEGIIQVWRIEPEWKLLSSFSNEFTETAKPVFIDPEGRVAGTVTRFQSTAFFWDANTGEELFQIAEEAPITAAAFSPRQPWVAFGCGDGRVTVWDWARRQKLDCEMKHDRYVTAVEFSPDGGFLASSSNDQTARVWNLEQGAALALAIHHKHEITGVRFSDDSRFVATAGLDRAAQIWDLANSRRVVDPVIHSEGLTAVCFVQGGAYLATTSYGSLGWLWKINRAIERPLQLRMEGCIVSVEVSPDGARMAAGDNQGNARLWDINTGQALGPALPHSNVVNAVTFSPNQKQLLTASFDGAARVWDLETGRVRFLPHDEWVRTAKFNQDGTRALTASHDRTAKIWDLKSGTALSLEHNDDVEDAVFSHNGKFVATASKDNFGRLWEAGSGRLLARLPHQSWVSSIRFSPDDRMILSASFDKTASLWSLDSVLSSPQPNPRTVLRHEGEVTSAEFSPNGEWVLTASYDRSARIWNARTGAPKPYFLAHEQPVVFAEFSPDNRRVVTASRDGSARIWSVASGHPLTGPLLHKETVAQARFGPGGNWVVTASYDQTAQVWRLPAVRVSDSGWLSDLGQYVSRMTLDSEDQFVPLTSIDHQKIKRALRSQAPLSELVLGLLGGEESPGGK